MNDTLARDLVGAAQRGSLQSMVLVPSEQPAVAHVYPEHDGGWVITLDCRRVLSDLVRLVVEKSGAGACQIDEETNHPNVVHVTVRVDTAGLLRRLFVLLIQDHERTRPGVRLAAILLDDDGYAPRRVDVVRPAAAPRPARARALRIRARETTPLSV